MRLKSMKFSIVTPTFNSSKYLHETIQSVLSQEGNFSIEYILIDNCSTDDTMNIIRYFEELISRGKFIKDRHEVTIKLHSEPDNSMYSAINKGFSVATGDIYAWINSDDIYLPNAFQTVYSVFKKYPFIKWMKGITSYINSDSKMIKEGKCFLYNTKYIQKGAYGREWTFIQQDSVFWKPSLWEKVGGVDDSLNLAGDYKLWIDFSNYADLVSVNHKLSCFRMHENQLSNNFERYKKEMSKISSMDILFNFKTRLFDKLERYLPFTLIPLFHRYIFNDPHYKLIIFKSGDEATLLNGSLFDLEKYL